MEIYSSSFLSKVGRGEEDDWGCVVTDLLVIP